MKLAPFDFAVIYKLGKDNQGADAFSQIPQHVDFFGTCITDPYRFF